MINYLLILCLILCGGISISLILKKEIGQAILLYFLLIIFMLYTLGLFIPLNVSSYIIMLLTILSFCYGIKKNKNIKEIFKSPVLYIFSLMFVFLLLINYGKGIVANDEYTHWGDIVYAMFQNNVLSVNHLNDAWYASYPPTISLLQYFIMKINAGFSEGLLYFTYQLFGVSLFLPFLDKIKFKNKLHFIIILLIMCVMPIILFENYYNTIYVDALLGMLFGFTFVYPYIYKKMDKFNILTLGISLFALTLLKDAGLFLSIISLINLLFVLKKEDKKHFFIVLGTCLLSILFAKVSWELAILLNDTVKSHEGTFVISTFIDVFNGTADEIKITVKDHFISSFSNNLILTKPLNLTYFSLTLLFTLIIFLMYKDNKKYYNSIILLIIGSFIYMFGLLIIFLFNFQEYESLGLYSYDRYSIIYLNGILFFIIISLITKYQDMKKIIPIAIIILIFVPTGILTNIIPNNTDKNRNEFVQHVSKINKDDKVLVYSDGYQKYEYAKYHYLLRPIKLTEDCDYSCISSDKKILESKKYDYLYVDKVAKNVKVDNIYLKKGEWYKIKNGKLIVDKS